MSVAARNASAPKGWKGVGTAISLHGEIPRTCSEYVCTALFGRISSSKCKSFGGAYEGVGARSRGNDVEMERQCIEEQRVGNGETMLEFYGTVTRDARTNSSDDRGILCIREANIA